LHLQLVGLDAYSHYPSATESPVESPREHPESGGGHWELPSRTGPDGSRFRTALKIPINLVRWEDRRSHGMSVAATKPTLARVASRLTILSGFHTANAAGVDATTEPMRETGHQDVSCQIPHAVPRPRPEPLAKRVQALYRVSRWLAHWQERESLRTVQRRGRPRAHEPDDVADSMRRHENSGGGRMIKGSCRGGQPSASRDRYPFPRGMNFTLIRPPHALLELPPDV